MNKVIEISCVLLIILSSNKRHAAVENQQSILQRYDYKKMNSVSSSTVYWEGGQNLRDMSQLSKRY